MPFPNLNPVDAVPREKPAAAEAHPADAVPREKPAAAEVAEAKHGIAPYVASVGIDLTDSDDEAVTNLKAEKHPPLCAAAGTNARKGEPKPAPRVPGTEPRAPGRDGA